MRCRDARRALVRRADERLELELGFELDAHLEGCAACRERVERSDALDEALARLPEPPLERLDVERSVATIRARLEAAPAARRPRLAAPLTWTTLAAAASLALAVVWSHRDERGAAERPGEAVAERAPDAPSAANGAADLAQTGPAPRPGDAGPSAPSPGEPRIAAGPDPAPPGADTAATNPVATNPVDGERLERARGEVRGRLLAAAEGLGEAPGTAEVTAFALRFDEATTDLRSDDWPVLRLVERALRNAPAAAAIPAARYLGRRGDRATWSQLEEALEREDLEFAVVDALADAGENGLDGLESALRRPALREAALRALSGVGGEGAAARLAAVLAEERAAAPGLPPGQDLVEALVELDGHALGAVLALGEAEALRSDELVAALERMPAAPPWLTRELADARRSDDPALLVHCAARLSPEAAAAWLVDHARDRRHGALVRAELPHVAGPPGVTALVDLAQDSSTHGDTLDSLVARSLEVDAQRFGANVDDLGHGGRVVLAELLIGAESPLAIDGLRVLVERGDLPDEVRRDLLLAVGEVGDETDAELLLAVFAGLREDERLLAAACLVALDDLGGEPAVLRALQGAQDRDQRNLLELLRRRKAGSGTTSSIYKLARGLRPFLSARDRTNTDTSS